MMLSTRLVSAALPCAFDSVVAKIAVMAASKEKNVWAQLARYSQLALVLPLCTAIGYVLGWIANHKWLHRDWIEIVGLLLGIAAGFVELVRTVSGSVEEDKPK